MNPTCATPDALGLLDQLQKARDRLRTMKQDGETAEYGALQRLDGEWLLPEIGKLLGFAGSDSGAARQCQNVLNRLNSLLDDVEDALEWSALVEQAQEQVAFASNLVKTDKYANAEDRRIFDILERETREAIEHRVPDLLRRRLEALSGLVGGIVRRNPDSSMHRLVLEPHQSAVDGSVEIVGRVLVPHGSSAHGLSLDFANEDAQPEWRSGPIPVQPNGGFSVTARISPSAATNEFHVDLLDVNGNRQKLTPDYVVLRVRKGETIPLEAE